MSYARQGLRAGSAVVVVCILQACADASRPPHEPEARQDAYANGPQGYPPPPGQPGQPMPGQPGQAQPGQPGQPTPSAVIPRTTSSARSERLRSFFAHGVALDEAGADCRSACRALGAMDRTAGELCEIDGRDGICKEAEGRVRDARDKVRGACGTCPDGLTLDRNAPVPSHH